MKEKSSKLHIVGTLVIFSLIMVFIFSSERTATVSDAVTVFKQNGIDVTESDLKVSSGFTLINDTIDTVDVKVTPIDLNGNPITDTNPIQEKNNILSTLFGNQTAAKPITMNITAKKIYEDGSTKTFKASSFELALLGLDFLTLSGDEKPIGNGKIILTLENPNIKSIKTSNFVVQVFVDDDLSETLTFQPSNKNLEIKSFDLAKLLPSTGTKKVKIVAKEMYFVTDGGNLYLKEPVTIYQFEAEKSTIQTIVKNEQGEYVKIYDKEVKLSFDSIQAAYSPQYCLAKERGGGCSEWTYIQGWYYKAPPIGTATLKDSEGNIIATGSFPGGACTLAIQEGGAYCKGTSGYGGTVLAANLEYGKTYSLTTSSPVAATIKIVVPTDKYVEYHYWCSRSGCNFP